MKRTQATDLIQELSIFRARIEDGQVSKEHVGEWLSAILGSRVPAAKKCPGDAHSNPYIDNCGLCAPQWAGLWTRN